MSKTAGATHTIDSSSVADPTAEVYAITGGDLEAGGGAQSPGTPGQHISLGALYKASRLSCELAC